MSSHVLEAVEKGNLSGIDTLGNTGQIRFSEGLGSFPR